MTTEEKFANVFMSDVCNFGLLPMTMAVNPIYLTVKQFIDTPEIGYEGTIVQKFYSHLRKASKAKSLFDIYRLFANDEFIEDCDFLKNLPNDAEFLAWRYCKPSGKLSLSWDHYYHDKLVALYSSIRDHGYDPERFKKNSRWTKGHVTGHILQEKNEKKYFITQGQKRIATFFALNPTKSMKILLDQNTFFRSKRVHPKKKHQEKKFKREYFLKDSHNWPSVKSKFIEKEQAQAMFKMFLHPEKDRQWKIVTLRLDNGGQGLIE